MIITQEEYDIDNMMKKLLDRYREWGMNINFVNTEYLTSGFRKDIIIENKVVKNLSHFKNFESELAELGEAELEIRNRVAITRKTITSNRMGKIMD